MKTTLDQEGPDYRALIERSREVAAATALLKTTNQALEQARISADVASNGREAVEKVRCTDCDVVLMDMQMPEMDGLKATEAMRALPGREGRAIIAVTANAFDDDRAKCLEAGMNDFIAKPFCPDTLFEKLARGAGPSPR